MTYINLPDNRDRRLVFYLAMEEYVAGNLDKLLGDVQHKDAVFMWQVKPTVIFGRNQVMEAEVNMPYCREKGIQLYRRKSGGGCVYSDSGNIMLSYITDTTDVKSTFDRYLELLAGYLRDTGVNAVKSGRNDILVDGKKVSGNAFFLKPKSSIVHGTMLFDSDFDELERAITPSGEKIKSKGVSSVRQHVTNLKEHYEASEEFKALADIDNFKRYIAERFCGNAAGDGIVSIDLTPEQIAEIESIEAGYLDPDFLSGRNHAFAVSRKGKIAEVGEINAELDVDGGKIVKCCISGDFFPLKEGLNEKLGHLLAEVEDNPEAIEAALEGFDATEYVVGLSTKALAEIIAGKIK